MNLCLSSELIATEEKRWEIRKLFMGAKKVKRDIIGIDSRDLEQVCKKIDSYIREGKQGLARRTLLKIETVKIPRSSIADLADFARRLNMPKFMIKTLRPIIRSKKLIRPPATDRERALYGSALSRLGYFSEAIEILSQCHGSSYPQATMFLAQTYMVQLNYLPAIAPLIQYLKDTKLSLYSRLVGKVNLAYCYVALVRAKPAKEILEELLVETSRKTPGQDSESFQLLKSNALELSAELAIYEGDYAQAEILLAQNEMRNSESRYELYLKKWRAIVKLLKNPQDPVVIESLNDLKGVLLDLNQREDFRDCMFFEALANRNDLLFLQIYHGTRAESFKTRIKNLYRPNFKIPESVVWQFGKQESSIRIFDLSRVCEDGRRPPTQLASLPFRLLQILTEDFFCSIPLGQLTAKLYPAEHYNPHSSPQKAQQVVLRLREWFQENKIPLIIDVKSDRVRLLCRDSYAIRVYSKAKKPSRNAALLEMLSKTFGKDEFSSTQVESALSLSRRSVQRFLKWAKEGKQVSEIVSGRSFSYRLKPKKGEKIAA